MKLKSSIALSDTGFVFDPASGNSFTTNPLALQIIRYLQQHLSREQIITQLLDHYEVDAVTLERDVNDFINVLKRLKLVNE